MLAGVWCADFVNDAIAEMMLLHGIQGYALCLCFFVVFCVFLFLCFLLLFIVYFHPFIFILSVCVRLDYENPESIYMEYNSEALCGDQYVHTCCLLVLFALFIRLGCVQDSA